MSRIGKLPVPISDQVKVSVTGGAVTVEGSKGKLTYTLPNGITAKIQELELQQDGEIKRTDAVVFERSNDSRGQKALQGTSRSIVNNMIIGVTEGYQKKLEIVGTGYNAKLQGKTLELQVGFANLVRYDVPTGIEIELGSQTQLTISGADKQLVGEVAAEIRAIQPPEPYKGKGIRYADEAVRRKAGKAFVATE